MLDYLEALYDAFDADARAAGGPVDRCYDLGGVRVLVRLATPALSSFTRALEHRSSAAGETGLAVCVGGGDAAPAPPFLAMAGEWSPRRRPPVGADTDGGPVRALYVGTTGALSMLDVQGRRAIFWRNPRTARPFEGAAPLLHILTWWLGRHRRYPIHAAAVGTLAGGVLVAGTGGAGKSTTALACLDSPLLYAGDDYVLVSEDPPFVHSLYRSARVSAKQLAGLPRVAAKIGTHGPVEFGKILIFVEQEYAQKPVAGFPLRAALTVRITGELDSRLVAVPAVRTLDVLIPSSVIELPGLGRQGVQAIVRIVQSVPNYVLEAGTDLAQIPVVIARLLDGAHAP
ncbi:MAG TPA: hypothetical protein VMS64_06715 [Candidatus Methylomirabilis sp.]|nr:hypothetical protein [Candidatus Methylomirabilis sp.]